MAVNILLVRSYARDIYLYGNRRFSNISAEYHEPVKQYSAETYTLSQILNALNQGWITVEEYNETLAYRATISPDKLPKEEVK